MSKTFGGKPPKARKLSLPKEGSPNRVGIKEGPVKARKLEKEGRRKPPRGI